MLYCGNTKTCREFFNSFPADAAGLCKELFGEIHVLERTRKNKDGLCLLLCCARSCVCPSCLAASCPEGAGRGQRGGSWLHFALLRALGPCGAHPERSCYSKALVTMGFARGLALASFLAASNSACNFSADPWPCLHLRGPWHWLCGRCHERPGHRGGKAP